MTVQQWLSLAVETMADVANAKQEALWMLEHFAQLNHSQIRTTPHLDLPEHIVEQLDHALVRRSYGEPLAYILGNTPFWSLDLAVSPAVLVPRLETEMLVEWALAKANEFDSPSIVDLGTGSGAIALALAKSIPTAQVLGIDLSKQALAIAQANQSKNQIPNVSWLHSSWFDEVPTQNFELIISNPPYLARSDKDIHPHTIRYEPHLALFAEQSGLSHIKKILQTSRHWLAHSGWIAIEHGHQQGSDVHAITRSLGYQKVETHQDLNGQDRFTVGVWTGSNVG